VKNETVDIKIKNPQLTTVTLSNGTVANLYYSVRTKGHFVGIWGSPYDDRWTTTWEEGNSFRQVFASNSDYTVVTLVIGSPNDILMGYADVYIPAEAREDFQVEASFGYQYTIYDGLFPTGNAFDSYTDSGWSGILTIDRSTGLISSQETPTPSTTILTQSPTPRPTVPELSWLAAVPLLFAVFSIAVIVRHRKIAGSTK
jgi:hypothetical protein